MICVCFILMCFDTFAINEIEMWTMLQQNLIYDGFYLAACYNCGEAGHVQRDCPKSDSRACYQCGETGHLARDCPDRPDDDRKCYTCGEAGHLSRDCPDAEKEYDSPSTCYR